MNKDKAVRWDPSWLYRDVPDTIITSVTDDIEGFRAVVWAPKCPEARISVRRGALVLYCVYDEAGLVRRSIEGIEKTHCFYRFETSQLLTEAVRVYEGMRDNLRHYAIYTSDRCLDVITVKDPEFKSLRDPDV